MDVVLGVSMAPEAVRMVLVEGEAAGGVTVDQDGFHLTDQTTAVAVADRVVAAILGTRETAAQGGYRLKSSGVTWTDPAEAAALRNALAARKIENVMLVSAVMAAAALAQAAGSATNTARTALLFVEPTTATLAVVDTADGSVADVRRHPLPSSDEAALTKLAAMVSGAESMRARPDGLFLVGSDVDIPFIKPALEAATSLSVTTPEEPEMALARGASLAAANARLGAPSTLAMPYAGIPGRRARAGLQRRSGQPNGPGNRRRPCVRRPPGRATQPKIGAGRRRRHPGIRWRCRGPGPGAGSRHPAARTPAPRHQPKRRRPGQPGAPATIGDPAAPGIRPAGAGPRAGISPTGARSLPRR